MDYLKEYAVNIVAVSIMATVFENILPSGKYKKYISIVIGLVVMLCIMNPLALLSDYRGSLLSIPHFKLDSPSAPEQRSLVAEQFERDLADTIAQKVNASVGRRVTVFVTAAKNENGEITGIESVTLTPLGSSASEEVPPALDGEILRFVSREFDIPPENIHQGK